MESLSFDNFQRRAAKSLTIWQQEQNHYTLQRQQREKSLRNIALVFLLLIVIIGSIAIAFVPSTGNVAIGLVGLLLILAATTWRIHHNEIASWEQRANRLFVPELKANIIKAYFPSLVQYETEQSPHKIMYKSQLYPNLESLRLEHQWEGFVGNSPTRLVISRLGLAHNTHDVFIQIKVPADTAVAYYWQDKALGNEHVSGKPLAEFGYFGELETTFRFFCDARGYLAAFIERNQYILQQIAQLQFPCLQVGWHHDDIFCRFDAEALKALLSVEFSQSDVSNQLESWYKSLLRLEELIGLLAQLSPPASVQEENEL